ncbi:MAG: murein DD-endopeptidase MepM/ murein hydrolase activator NlpD [Limisphaerales bacterium]|jgi:murein DD-endopeptidase MepM/ murein hydrolase activator NlpD
MALIRVLILSLLVVLAPSVPAQQFHLPTPNRQFGVGDEARFYAPTSPDRDWVSGSYGCVRTKGGQFHEGIDILRVNTDRHGEPIDKITAAAEGQVAYLSRSSGASLYGKYVVLQHKVEGVLIYTLYAHLSSIKDSLRIGSQVRAGTMLGILGRTANTRTRIGRERAHVHFEVALLANRQFSGWHKKAYEGKNEHGIWHGWNLLGLDPTEVFRRPATAGNGFSMLNYIRYQREMCRVLVPKTDFSFARDYRPLMRRNATAERAGIDGYELVLNFAGIPCQLIPRSKQEVKFESGYTLLRVIESEALSNRCRKLITKERGKWRLTKTGTRFLDILTFR